MEQEMLLLSKIGLSDTESKVYLTLLQNRALSGYETSKLAGVPRSKIYNLLENLVQKGFVLYTEIENNNKYAAIPISEISDRIKHETKTVLSELSDRLSIFPQKTEMDYMWHIRNNGNVFAKCRELINKAKKEVLIQIWAEDIEFILAELQALEAIGVRIGLVVFSNDENLKLPLQNVCRHGMIEDKKREMGGRWITLVSDMEEVVFGQILSENIAEVIWSKSRAMIFLAAECVRHDLYFYKSAYEFKEIMEQEYGKELGGVRDIF